MEWATRSENSQHGYDNGLIRCHFTDDDRKRAGETIARTYSKPVYVLETHETFPSASECARQMNLDPGNIVSCCNGHRKHHGGYTFFWA